VGAFLPECPRYLKELRDAVERADPHHLERTAHGLRGAVLIFGAETASRLAEKLEALGRQGGVEGAAGVLGALERELAALQEYLSRYLSGPAPAPEG